MLVFRFDLEAKQNLEKAKNGTCSDHHHPILIRVYPRKRGWPDLPHSLTAISPTQTLHLARFKASSFAKPTLLLSFSTCVFHVFFGRPRSDTLFKLVVENFCSKVLCFGTKCPGSVTNWTDISDCIPSSE